MIYLFPESCAYPGTIDRDFQAQSKALAEKGCTVLPVNEKGKIIGNHDLYQKALYRGWMMSFEEYQNFYHAVDDQGVYLTVNPGFYHRCHYISGWYQRLQDLTIESVFFKSINEINESNIPAWNKYFVKDFVKSLTTKRGSVASNIDEIKEVASLIEQYRGRLDGGVCVRRFVNLQADSEERYFVTLTPGVC